TTLSRRCRATALSRRRRCGCRRAAALTALLRRKSQRDRRRHRHRYKRACKPVTHVPRSPHNTKLTKDRRDRCPLLLSKLSLGCQESERVCTSFTSVLIAVLTES